MHRWLRKIPRGLEDRVTFDSKTNHGRYVCSRDRLLLIMLKRLSSWRSGIPVGCLVFITAVSEETVTAGCHYNTSLSLSLFLTPSSLITVFSVSSNFSFCFVIQSLFFLLLFWYLSILFSLSPSLCHSVSDAVCPHLSPTLCSLYWSNWKRALLAGTE